MTLSARASTLGGIVKPVCFAVFRLITSSNLLGCSTGRNCCLFRIPYCDGFQVRPKAGQNLFESLIPAFD